MYKRILVPLDGSEIAETSLTYAKSLATVFDGEIILISIVHPLPASAVDIYGPETTAEVINEMKTKLKKYLTKIQHQLNKENIKTRAVIAQGKAPDEIINYAKTQKVDLIVISSHGETGFTHWIMGNVASRVIHHSTVPVMLIYASDKNK